MVALRFCANLNFLFTEVSGGLLERYRAAAAAGFTAVEGPTPSPDISVETLAKVQQETGLEQILLNISTDDASGAFGCAALPGQEEAFRRNLERTVAFAKALNCRKVHIMAGKLNQPVTDANHNTYLSNLRAAVPILEKHNIVGVIEPINKYAVPGYYLACYDRAISVLNTIASPNLKLMLDLYHAQHIRGDLTHAIQQYRDHIGHIQLAQVPSRQEPSVDGEVNYRYVLQTLANEGSYADGWIGCEYRPSSSDTVQGLAWLRDFGYWQ